MATICREILIARPASRGASAMPSVSPWLLVLLLVSTPALADPVAIEGGPATVATQDAVRVFGGARGVLLEPAERVYEFALGSPIGTLQLGEAGCAGATTVVGDVYVVVTTDATRCMPSLRGGPRIDDACGLTGPLCCRTVGVECAKELMDNVMGRLNGREPVAFCAGLTNDESPEVEAQVGKSCSDAPDGA